MDLIGFRMDPEHRKYPQTLPSHFTTHRTSHFTPHLTPPHTLTPHLTPHFTPNIHHKNITTTNQHTLTHTPHPHQIYTLSTSLPMTRVSYNSAYHL